MSTRASKSRRSGEKEKGRLTDVTSMSSEMKVNPELLPKRLYPTDRYPPEGRINSYSKPHYLLDLVHALRGTTALTYLQASCFKSLFEFPVRRCSFSGKLVHQMLCRSLHSRKKYEIWFVFAGQPLRFSLREFGIITGLVCCPYPSKADHKDLERRAKSDDCYWNTLFGKNKSTVLIKDIIAELQKDKILPDDKKMDPERRIRLALIVIVEGILICTSGVLKASKEVVEMVKDLESFESYPWGRKSFERTVEMVKVSKKTPDTDDLFKKLNGSHTSTHGFTLSFQLMFLEAIPQLNSIIEDDDVSTISNTSITKFSQKKLFHNYNILDVEKQPDIHIEPFLPAPDRQYDSINSWDDEVVDNDVVYLERLIGGGFNFTNNIWGVLDDDCEVIHVAQNVPKKEKMPVHKHKGKGKVCGEQTSSKSEGVKGGSENALFDMSALMLHVELKVEKKFALERESLRDEITDNIIRALRKDPTFKVPATPPPTTPCQGTPSKDVSPARGQTSPNVLGDCSGKVGMKASQAATGDKKEDLLASMFDDYPHVATVIDGINNSHPEMGGKSVDHTGQQHLSQSSSDGDASSSSNEEQSNNDEDAGKEVDNVSDAADNRASDTDDKTGSEDNYVQPIDKLAGPIKSVPTADMPIIHVVDNIHEENKPVLAADSVLEPVDIMDEDNKVIGLEANTPVVTNKVKVPEVAMDKAEEKPRGQSCEGQSVKGQFVENKLREEASVEDTVSVHQGDTNLPTEVSVPADDVVQNAEQNEVSLREEAAVEDTVDGEHTGCGIHTVGTIPLNQGQDSTPPSTVETTVDMPPSNVAVHQGDTNLPTEVSVPADDVVQIAEQKEVSLPIADGNSIKPDFLDSPLRQKRLACSSTEDDSFALPAKRQRQLPLRFQGTPTLELPHVDVVGLAVKKKFMAKLKSYKDKEYVIDGHSFPRSFFKDIYDNKFLFPQHIDCMLKFVWIKHSRQLLRSKIGILDSSFTREICNEYQRWKKSKKRDSWPWSRPLKKYVEGIVRGRLNKLGWFLDVDSIYAPMNLGDDHWVAIFISLGNPTINVFDPNTGGHDQDALEKKIQPLAEMIPAMISQLASFAVVGGHVPPIFHIVRAEDIPQLNKPSDWAPFCVKVIELNSIGVPFTGITDKHVEKIRLKFAVDIYEEFIMSIS